MILFEKKKKKHFDPIKLFNNKYQLRLCSFSMDFEPDKNVKQEPFLLSEYAINHILGVRRLIGI